MARPNSNRRRAVVASIKAGLSSAAIAATMAGWAALSATDPQNTADAAAPERAAIVDNRPAQQPDQSAPTWQQPGTGDAPPFAEQPLFGRRHRDHDRWREAPPADGEGSLPPLNGGQGDDIQPQQPQDIQPQQPQDVQPQMPTYRQPMARSRSSR